jgi:hypothetical protein
MKVTPRTEEELEMDGLLPEGTYPFSVQQAEEKVSKKGNAMIKLTLRLYGENGREGIVWDYLMDSMPQRLAQFCRFTGLEDRYNAGEVEAPDCENREGYVTIRTEKGKDGFPPKNVVHYYSAKPAPKPAAKVTTGLTKADGAADEDDSIPF